MSCQKAAKLNSSEEESNNLLARLLIKQNEFDHSYKLQKD